jgi:hypothetical protein
LTSEILRGEFTTFGEFLETKKKEAELARGREDHQAARQ